MSSRKKTFTPPPPPPPPHFFKIIVDDNIRHRKLAIPRKFIRGYGDNLPKKVLLQVPSGKVWPIQLVEHEGDVWLQQGWEEFAKFYSLAHGHLIVFRFEGNGDFRILIFDKSASEIEYPCLSSHGQSELDLEEVTSDDFSSEKSDKTVSVKRTRPSMCRRSSKRIKTNAAGNRYGGLRSQADNDLKNVPEGGGRDVTRTMKQSTVNENDKTFEISASENLSFSVVMHASYLRTRSTLDIPSNFAKKHLTKGNGFGDAILRISDNTTWPIKYSSEASRENPRAKFYNGWSTFARDNNLKVGDVCVFELIQSTKLVLFTVNISPEADDSNSRQATNVMEATSIKLKPVKVEPDSTFDYDTRSPSRQKTLSNPQLCKTRSRGAENNTIERSEESTFDRRYTVPSLTREEKSKALQRANTSFKSKNPFFTVTIQPTYIYGGAVNLPSKFVKDYLMNDKNKNCEVTLRLSGKSWTVGLQVTTRAGKPSLRKAIFGSNWRGFVRDNNLKVGDTCVFELTEGVKSSLNVVVIRVKDCSLSRCE